MYGIMDGYNGRKFGSRRCFKPLARLHGHDSH